MCGIVGAIASENIVENILEGLKKLEYRGYDSAGISVLDQGQFKTVKEEGKIDNLVQAISGSPLDGYLDVENLTFGVELEGESKNAQKDIHYNYTVKSQKSQEKSNLLAIGHTRWATHGRPSQENSHPHSSSEICVVHNGIIENYQEIRAKLAKIGADFLSETDSEVVPHLIQENFRIARENKNRDVKDQIKDAVLKTLSEIEGSYALAVMFRDHPDFILVAKKGSPLLVGVGENCNYIASDYYALADNTNKVIYLNDGEFAFVSSDDAEFFNEKGEKIQREVKVMESLEEKASKGDFEHFMLKEIYEQPQVIEETIQNYVDLNNFKVHLPNFPFDLEDINKITIVACGTSYYAGMAAKYLFEDIARIEVEVDIASEFRYRKSVFRDDNLMIFISQSGETADTIAALKHAKDNNQKILSIVNVANSSMADLSDVVVKSLAGIEIGVASTKAYTAQIMVLSLLAVEFGDLRGKLAENGYDKAEILSGMTKLGGKFLEVLKEENVLKIQETARYLAKFDHILYVGRGISYVTALEGALKFKELSYVDAQAIAAGELKHGTIALIDEEMPVVAVAVSNELFEKTASNIEEIKARGGKIIVVSDELGVSNFGNLVDFSLVVSESLSLVEEVLVGVVPLQLLAYYVSLFRGNDVDQPRNLAKSVTVE